MTPLIWSIFSSVCVAIASLAALVWKLSALFRDLQHELKSVGHDISNARTMYEKEIAEAREDRDRFTEAIHSIGIRIALIEYRSGHSQSARPPHLTTRSSGAP